MSWSIHPEIKSEPAAKAKEMVAEQANLPTPIRDYIVLGVDALVVQFGEGVLVTVTGYGHLCTGADHAVTSATIDVRQA